MSRDGKWRHLLSTKLAGVGGTRRLRVVALNGGAWSIGKCVRARGREGHLEPRRFLRDCSQLLVPRAGMDSAAL